MPLEKIIRLRFCSCCVKMISWPGGKGGGGSGGLVALVVNFAAVHQSGCARDVEGCLETHNVLSYRFMFIRIRPGVTHRHMSQSYGRNTDINHLYTCYRCVGPWR